MSHPDILNRENTALVVIDLQEKLLPVMHNREELIQNARKLVQFARMVDIPVVVTEQYPRWLGATMPEIKDLIPDYQPIKKVSFSATDCEDFSKRIEGYSQIILTGVETHICICQTALNLSSFKKVHIIADAVSARTVENHQIGLNKCASAGCIISSTETAMYEILKKAGTGLFKSVRHLLL